MSTADPRPPKKLGAAGRRFWRSVMEDFTLAGPHEETLLEQACRELDIIDRLDDALADADLVVSTPAHGEVANRLLSEVQQHRTAFRLLLRDLKLPSDPAQSAKGGSVVRLAQGRARRSHRAAS
jgi:hypothetical protein